MSGKRETGAAQQKTELKLTSTVCHTNVIIVVVALFLCVRSGERWMGQQQRSGDGDDDNERGETRWCCCAMQKTRDGIHERIWTVAVAIAMSASSRRIDAGLNVVVTGASGMLGSHIVEVRTPDVPPLLLQLIPQLHSHRSGHSSCFRPDA